MEAAISISILAIGLARLYQRRCSLLENIILTGMGGTSASVVSGPVFTMPALSSDRHTSNNSEIVSELRSSGSKEYRYFANPID